MNSASYFPNSRHPARAAALALSLTVGMLLSVNGLATSATAEVATAAHAASNAQAMSQTLRVPQS